jgi:glycosyltransferase involved in cell wall biosynthesis
VSVLARRGTEEAKPPRAGADRLRDVLVVTVRKSFWASPECEIFPHRLYAPIVRGHSTNLLNTLVLGVKVVLELVRRRPKLVFFGSAPRLVPFVLVLRRLGLVRSGIVATSHSYFGRRLGRYADRVIVHSHQEGEGWDNCVFLPIPADGDFAAVVPYEDDAPYVFSGGGTLRDFRSLIDAVAGLDIRLALVTFSPKTLAAEGDLPDNVTVMWRMPLERFLSLMAGSQFVVVPLQPGAVTGGHTTIAQALCLGKAVVTTRGVGVEDYVTDGREGLLVAAGDAAGYRTAIQRLMDDEELRRSCEVHARARAPELSYASFARGVEALCIEVLEERERR